MVIMEDAEVTGMEDAVDVDVVVEPLISFVKPI